MYSTDVIAARELRNNHAAVVQKLEERDSIVITNRGKGQAVPINFKDLRGYEKYLHMRYVKERLLEAEHYAESADAQWLSHDEFWALAQG
jgi:prevent-host-death family protein